MGIWRPPLAGSAARAKNASMRSRGVIDNEIWRSDISATCISRPGSNVDGIAPTSIALPPTVAITGDPINHALVDHFVRVVPLCLCIGANGVPIASPLFNVAPAIHLVDESSSALLVQVVLLPSL